MVVGGGGVCLVLNFKSVQVSKLVNKRTKHTSGYLGLEMCTGLEPPFKFIVYFLGPCPLLRRRHRRMAIGGGAVCLVLKRVFKLLVTVVVNR